MYYLRYNVKTKASVIFALSSGERNTVRTYNYFPGTSLLGMFASGYIRIASKEDANLTKNAHLNEQFKKWFLEGGLTFTNAYIKGKNNTGEEFETLPYPRTIKRHKYKDEYYNDLETDTEDTKTIDGYGFIRNDTLYKAEVKKSLNFHLERDPDTGASVEGKIFNYESIDKNQEFTGYIFGNEKDIKNFYEVFYDYKYFSAGRSKNSQYGGNITLNIDTPAELNDNKDNIILNHESYSQGIIMTLLSDMIIYNEYGNSSTNINVLEKELRDKIDNKDIIISKATASQTENESFVSVWKLKKPSEICFAAGSVFKIKGLKEENTEKIKNLIKNGIGERKQEGFGRIVFGYYTGKINNIATKETATGFTKVNKPSTQMPETVYKIVNSISKRKAENTAKSNAINISGEIEIKKLNAAFISRLNEICSVSNSKKEFVENLNNLRKPAKDKLENTYITIDGIKISLIEFLQKLDEKYYCPQIMISGFKNTETDEEHKFKLYKQFIATFFTNVRLNIKKGEK